MSAEVSPALFQNEDLSVRLCPSPAELSGIFSLVCLEPKGFKEYGMFKDT